MMLEVALGSAILLDTSFNLRYKRCMTKTTQQEVQDEADKIRQEHPSTRKGQALFLSLEHFHPEFTESIVGTDCDPFYQDRNIPDFWEAYACWMAD